ncbi:MAG: sigma-70 family RNA polymerase sigma factor [Prevotellaceae bacterium]|jgi:RNA polymerase sigma factor (sigma-70 family)|nr:sigma-70 family RNA polymerase sigma factor [Prevotellaceae bacterium]
MLKFTPEQETLFRKFKEGDDDAFSFFYQLFINDLYAYGRGLCAESEWVKDCVQDVFLKVYFMEKEYESLAHFKYFLLKSIKNKLYDLYKSKSFSATTPLVGTGLDFMLSATVLDEMIGADDKQIIKQKIDALLSKLTARQREVIYLRFIEEMDYAQIAELLGMNVTSARKLVSRSLKRLKDDQLPLFIYLFLLYSVD